MRKETVGYRKIVTTVTGKIKTGDFNEIELDHQNGFKQNKQHTSMWGGGAYAEVC